MGTVDRVLPWRRHHRAPADELEPLIRSYRQHHHKAPTTLITRAYEMAANAHSSQRRSSGEAYINHPIAVATIVAELGLDETSVASALLHDSVEDTEITVADLQRDFGAEVATIVDGLTKLERVQFDSKEAQQAASMRKLMFAIAKDVRVLIIKLADRLHNMRTLAGTNEDKQRRVAQETLEIYAPLAHRLGMQGLKEQLEDLSFAAIYPKRYAELDHLVSTRSPEYDLFLARAIGDLQQALGRLGVHANVTGRRKALWSIYEKMAQKGRAFDEIFDVLAMRVIVDNVRDCYAALGTLHELWPPIPGRFKDYIATPKQNRYRSLHATVNGPGGRPLEVQIRTREMHEEAERGVAAHWAYKLGGSANTTDWIDRLNEAASEVTDPTQYLASLRSSLEHDEIYVMTPKNRVVTLPAGSTPVDFAYAVHTELGHSCIGARVNGRLVPLHHRLASGDICEVFRSKLETAGPSRDWLQFVASTRARTKVRQWFSRERRDDMIESGREELTVELRRAGVPVQSTLNGGEALRKAAESSGYADLESLFVAIGEHHVSARSIAQRIGRGLSADEGEEVGPPDLIRREGARRRPRRSVGVHVDGLDDVLVRLSKCCGPVPGDEIIGFVTKGRGVSVHRADCTNLAALSSADAPSIGVEWDEDPSPDAVFLTRVEVHGFDRPRLLGDIANAMSDLRVNIVRCDTVTRGDGMAVMRFECEMTDPSLLDTVLRRVRAIDSVCEAFRSVPARQ